MLKPLCVGTSIGEISLLTVALSAGYLLRCMSVVCLPSLRLWTFSNFVVSFLMEYATIVLPGILVFTVFADYVAYVLAGLVTISLFVNFQRCNKLHDLCLFCISLPPLLILSEGKVKAEGEGVGELSHPSLKYIETRLAPHVPRVYTRACTHTV